MKHALKIRVFVADNDRLGMIENRVYIINHEPRYVRDAVQDEVTVRAHQAGNVDVFIVDTQVIALSQQTLNDFNYRALT